MNYKLPNLDSHNKMRSVLIGTYLTNLTIISTHIKENMQL